MKIVKWPDNKFGFSPDGIIVVLPQIFESLDVEDLLKRIGETNGPFTTENILEKKFQRWWWGWQHLEYIYLDLIELGFKPREARRMLTPIKDKRKIGLPPLNYNIPMLVKYER